MKKSDCQTEDRLVQNNKGEFNGNKKRSVKEPSRRNFACSIAIIDDRYCTTWEINPIVSTKI